MKVKIDKNGEMTITPENKQEDKQLHDWYQKNKRTECNKCIVFERGIK